MTTKPFPEPELYVLAVDLANIALSGKNGGKTAYEDVFKELQRRVGPALTVIDSILAEAGDERAPVKAWYEKSPLERDLEAIAVQESLLADYEELAIDAPTDKVLLSRFRGRIEELHKTLGMLKKRTGDAQPIAAPIQGWIDRLRGVRAALEEHK